MKFMKTLKLKRAKTAYEAKLHQAMEAQRGGDIQGYSKLTEEADGLLKELQALDTALS